MIEGRMAAQDYQYDVFFSYKRHKLTLGWIRRAHTRLKLWLEEEVGREIKMCRRGLHRNRRKMATENTRVPEALALAVSGRRRTTPLLAKARVRSWLRKKPRGISVVLQSRARQQAVFANRRQFCAEK